MAILTEQISDDHKNEMIRLPKTLKTDDGRTLHIKVWAPVLAVDDVVKVTLEAVIIKDAS